MQVSPDVRLSRRGFVLLAGTAALAGCTGTGEPSPTPKTGGTPGSSPTPSTPSADELAARRLVAGTLACLRAVDAARAAGPPPAVLTLLDAVEADHRAHLALLGAVEPSPSPSASSPSASSASSPSASSPSASSPSASSAASPSAAGSPATSPAGAPSAAASTAATARPFPALLSDLRSTETAAGAAALADLGPATPALAAVLVRVAAARAVHADLVQRAQKVKVDVPPPPALPDGTGSDAAAGPAVEALLAGEHAAVYAFGWVTARTTGADQTRARAAWSLHRQQRDALERLLVTASATPPAAEPAYDLGSPTPATVAATVEKGLATVAVSGAVQTSGPTRAAFAQVAVLAARRAALWEPQPFLLPG